VFQVDREKGELTLTELAPGMQLDEVKQKTGAKFKVADDLKEMEQ
jgi:3-oxoacid CoA-transferase